MRNANISAKIHLPTVVAVAAIVWISVTLLHELLGHGGMCVLVNGLPRAVSSTEFRCDELTDSQYKMVVAAGSTANILAALVSLLLLRVAPGLSPVWRYFMWLFITVNFFHAGTYMLVGPFTGYGDWAYFIEGWEPRLIWPVLITAVGAGLCLLGQRLAARPYWQPLLGHEAEERRTRMQILTRVPLMTALVINVLAGLLSPLRMSWVLPTSLVAPFVILWLVNTPRWPKSDDAAPPARIGPQRGWMLAGILFAAIFIGLFGPGIGSFAGHPLVRP